MAHVSTEEHDRTSLRAIEGVQNEPPQTVPIQQVDYFELKTSKARTGRAFYLPLNYLKEFR